MPSDLILSEGKIPIYISYRERVGNAVDGQRRRGLNESRDKDSYQLTFRRTDERVDVRAIPCPYDGETILKGG